MRINVGKGIYKGKLDDGWFLSISLDSGLDIPYR
jgi:hypothetical protein